MEVLYNMCAITCEQRGAQSDEFDISTRAHVQHLVVLHTPKIHPDSSNHFDISRSITHSRFYTSIGTRLDHLVLLNVSIA